MDCLDPQDPKGEGKRFMCRKCEACRARWRSMWTGRLMAEHASASATWFVTLTYGGGYENPEAYSLDKAHLDEFYHRLRRRGFRFRPVGTGEFGGQLGRAHWHLILFFYGRVPEVPMDQRFMWNWTDKRGIERQIWQYGWAQCEYPKSPQATVAYVLKYLDKPPEDRGEFSFGKRPAVGETYLREFARKRGEAGLMLFPKRMPVYQVEGNVKDKGDTAGQLYDYWLDSQSVLLPSMISEYVRAFRHRWTTRLIPPCQFVTQWAEGLNGEERQELGPVDRVRQHFSVLDRLHGLGLPSGKLVQVHTGLDKDCAVLECKRTGAMEARWYSEEGEVEWRDVVASGRKDHAGVLRLLRAGELGPSARALAVNSGLPGKRPRSGFWRPRDISTRQNAPQHELGPRWQKLDARGHDAPQKR